MEKKGFSRFVDSYEIVGEEVVFYPGEPAEMVVSTQDRHAQVRIDDIYGDTLTLGVQKRGLSTEFEVFTMKAGRDNRDVVAAIEWWFAEG